MHKQNSCALRLILQCICLINKCVTWTHICDARGFKKSTLIDNLVASWKAKHIKMYPNLNSLLISDY